MNASTDRLAAAVALAAFLCAGCHTMSDASLPPLELAPAVDIPRFMGDWYVIANIPTVFEKGAHSAKESYSLNSDGTIATTFTFRADGFEGTPKAYHSKGIVLGEHGAGWGQQYLWPFKADYRISYVSPAYETTVITREKRDHVWIMARTPTIPQADYDRLVEVVARQGYDVAKLERVPQRGG